MAELKIGGAELLSTLENYCEHLLACEQFLFDLSDHPAKPLEKQYLNHSGAKLDKWDQERIDKAVVFVLKYRATAELTDQKKLRPVEAFFAELPRLREAESIVTGLSWVLRYQLPEPTREEHIEMHKRGERTLRERLDSLTKFDDSE